MTLSVAGALVELKLLDKKIDKAIHGGIFVSYKNGNDIPKGYKNVDELQTKIRANNQSVLDLIKRRNKIKSAIVVSNATTNVTVAEIEMTVAEAIERKNSIEYEKQLLTTYKNQLAQTLRNIDTINQQVSQRADQMVHAYLGNDVKNKADEANTLRENFVNAHSASLIDAIDIKKKIEELEDYIDNFEAEVDLVLSTSNAITLLDIE